MTHPLPLARTYAYAHIMNKLHTYVIGTMWLALRASELFVHFHNLHRPFVRLFSDRDIRVRRQSQGISPCVIWTTAL